MFRGLWGWLGVVPAAGVSGIRGLNYEQLDGDLPTEKRATIGKGFATIDGLMVVWKRLQVRKAGRRAVGWLRWGTVMIVALGSPLVASTTPSSIGELVEIQQRIQAVLIPCQRATVGIGDGGSGVIVSADGLVLTAAHVSMRPGRRVTVRLHDGRRVTAETRGLNQFADAGLIQILDQGKWPFVEMSLAPRSKAGDWCFALGHPSGFDLDRGPVLRVGRVIGAHALVMRTDCHLIGGDSGGPLFDLTGKVIGIHSRVSEEIDDNYHAPIAAFRRHWKLFQANEAVQISSDNEGGFLGVQSELSLQGARVRVVFPETPAFAAGLLEGDVITAVDEIVVFDPDELGWALARHPPGTEVRIDLIRGSRQQTLLVKLGRRPEEFRR